MSKSRKHIHKKEKRRHKRRTIKHHRHNHREIIVPTSTPLNIRKVSNRIARKLVSGSYAPTINQDLVTLKSIPRKELLDCNIKEAFELKEQLEIGIPGNIYGKTCYNYNSNEAKKFLLKNLAADKHIDPKKIVPPIQLQSNCWFNAFFVTFFI